MCLKMSLSHLISENIPSDRMCSRVVDHGTHAAMHAAQQMITAWAPSPTRRRPGSRCGLFAYTGRGTPVIASQLFHTLAPRLLSLPVPSCLRSYLAALLGEEGLEANTLALHSLGDDDAKLARAVGDRTEAGGAD